MTYWREHYNRIKNCICRQEDELRVGSISHSSFPLSETITCLFVSGRHELVHGRDKTRRSNRYLLTRLAKLNAWSDRDDGSRQRQAEKRGPAPTAHSWRRRKQGWVVMHMSYPRVYESHALGWNMREFRSTSLPRQTVSLPPVFPHTHIVCITRRVTQRRRCRRRRHSIGLIDRSFAVDLLLPDF